MPNPPDRYKEDAGAELAAMKREMARMEEAIQRLANASAIENVLINGFSTLSTTLTEQLQPLADLTPKRTQMRPEEIRKLTRVRAELKRQIWTGTGTLDPPPCKDVTQAARLTAS
jgi:hypothetical protein